MKKLIILLFSFLIAGSLGAQTLQMNDSLKISYQDILSLKLAKAQQILVSQSQKYPNDVWIDYQKNFSDFLEVFISESEDLFDQKQNYFSARYDRISDLPDSNPYKLWMMANMNLQWAFVRVKFHQFFPAGWAINKAYRQIVQNQQQFPNFVPNGLTLGILHIMIGLVPDQYRWMLKLVSMQGTVSQGKREIFHVLETSLHDPKYSYLQDEALFYMGFIALNLTPNQSTLDKLKVYVDQIGNDHLLMAFLKADIYVRTGQNDKALHLLDQIVNRKGYYPFYYLNYMKGDCLIKKLDPAADKDYRYYLNHFRGINYIKDAWRKRAWVAMLKGDTLGYKRMMDSVLVHGARMVDADKQAYREAESNQLPNVNLLRARLLFDGGYYARAKNVLDTMSRYNLSTDERLERTYRFARIAHQQHHWKEAKKKYRQTIEEGRYSPLYFAGNAALKLGVIYENEDSLQQAALFYSLCLQLDFKEYRNSIRGKAKESLARVQQEIHH